jgi:ligand-binding sensor domain-containing protein/class 3 adenylate cyclase
VQAFFGSTLAAQSLPSPTEFERMSLERGLSQSSVLCSVQDKTGFMWFGTQDGLNRFDGYAFTVHRSVQGDTNSLSDNWVLALLPDKRGNLWIGTRRGLTVMDGTTGQMRRFFHNASARPNALSHNHIFSLLEDRQGVIWIGTEHGLTRFKPQDQTFFSYYADSLRPDALSDDRIYCMQQSADGTLWLGTEHGVQHFDPASGKCLHVVLPSGNKHKNLRGNSVLALTFSAGGKWLFIGTLQGLYRLDVQSQQLTTLDSESTVWSLLTEPNGWLYVGTGSSAGMYVLDAEGNRLVSFQHHPADERTLAANNVFSLYRDRSSTLWVGTLNGGVCTLNPFRKKFTSYRNDPMNPRSLSNNQVYAFYEENPSTLWIGTNGGAVRFDRHTATFETFALDALAAPSTTQALRSAASSTKDLSPALNNNIRCITTDAAGNLWFGTRQNGVIRYNPRIKGKQAWTWFMHDDNDATSIPNGQVWRIVRDSKGFLWFGTGNGIARFDPNTEQFRTFLSSASAMLFFSTDHAFAGIVDNGDGTMWLSSYSDGLWLVETRHDSVRVLKQLVHADGNPQSLLTDRVTSISKDRKGRLWAATANGLSLLNADGTTFTNFTEADGLPNSFIYGVVEDDAGMLWISTNKGLSRFNPDTRQFRNYDMGDGLQNNEFNRGALIRLSTGEVAFGGIGGFNLFHPSAIRDNNYSAPVVLTAFRVFQKPYLKLQRPLHDTREIWLRHNENYIAFEFAALDYTNPAKNHYAYKVEGIDEEWIYCGTRRYASYTNIPPGEYVLRVKAANSDGVWNDEGLTVRIMVTPPFWKTWWFFLLSALGIGGASYGVYRLRVQVMRSQNKFLERQVRERTAALEAERAKSEQLLLNTLPPPIAKRLLSGATTIVDRFDHASVLFADLANFTLLASSLSPEQLVELLDAVFSDFDAIANRYALEKIKTIGDCYMLVGGVPEPCADHAERIADAALEMLALLERMNGVLSVQLELRIGIHTGGVIAGVIGKNKFSYDLWGDTVNVASRMESHGETGKIHCSEDVYHLLSERYVFEQRGVIDIKGKGLMTTYFLKEKRPAFTTSV